MLARWPQAVAHVFTVTELKRTFAQNGPGLVRQVCGKTL